MFDEITKLNLLYDFYGQLLTKRQQEVMKLYHEENLSLSEIAEEFKISRQGVHDALKNAEKSLNEYEDKLKLVERFEKTRQAVEKIDKNIEELVEVLKENFEIKNKLLEIKTIIDKIEL